MWIIEGFICVAIYVVIIIAALKSDIKVKNIIAVKRLDEVKVTTIKIKDLRKFINQMEIEGLNDETALTFETNETKRSSEHIENITSMEYSPTTNILIFG